LSRQQEFIKTQKRQEAAEHNECCCTEIKIETDLLIKNKAKAHPPARIDK
jgi:hypothetical protein